MRYKGKVELAQERKIRERNTILYRCLHWPLWIWVFFLSPGPLTFSLFAHGFNRWNLAWLCVVLAGTGTAALFAQLPGTEPRPYILRFDEDRPNPLYRKVCYTFAWSDVLSYALLNLAGLIDASINGVWRMKQIYEYAYSPVCAVILLLGLLGKLPRVGPSTKGEGIERRYFYGAVWSAAIAQTTLLILWKIVSETQTGNLIKLVIFAGVLSAVGLAASRGMLPRTRPIVAGELIVD